MHNNLHHAGNDHQRIKLIHFVSEVPAHHDIWLYQDIDRDTSAPLRLTPQSNGNYAAAAGCDF
jgi:hypothetical protein